MKDKDGYAFVIGCLVKVHFHYGAWRGWVRRIEEGLLWVECERRAGGPRPVNPHAVVVTVVKPTGIDRAREIGNAKVVRETSERAHRASRLHSPKKVDR
ncbi:MAG: hypothetical protein V3U11_03890 [Planctomycetota bacterium]